MNKKHPAKIIMLLLVSMLLVGLVSACGSNKSNGESSNSSPNSSPASQAAKESSSAKAPENVTLKFWTWHPSADAYKPVIEKFEASHPGIKIDLTVMESKDFQTKMPLALTNTGEQLDVVGVQTGAMPRKIQDSLLPLDDLLEQAQPDWQSLISANSVEQVKSQTDGLKFLSMGSHGAMVMYYNKDILDELGFAAPKSYDELKAIAQAIKEKKKDILTVAVAGKDAWVLDEVLLTILGQQSDLYNRWRYNKGGRLDSPEYVAALGSFKKLFDDGVFNKDDIMDLDYTSSRNIFTSGQAAFFIQGTWEANLLSEQYRKDNQVTIKDVGLMAIPAIDPSGKATTRAYIENGLAIPTSSKHPQEAMEWIKYLVFGEGNDILSSQFNFTTNKVGFTPGASLLTTPTAQASFKLLVELVGSPTTDRNNNSPFSDVVGAQLQKMVLKNSAPADIANDIQKEFETGKYPN
jgi:raffinose/stachyose/melibiose transport system substrate-binding protein